MNENNRELLEDEIRVELDALGAMEIGSEPYKIAVDGLTKLIDRAINLKKIESDVEVKSDERDFEENLKMKMFERECEFKRSQMKIENDLKAEQLRNEQRDRAINNGIKIASIAIPYIITVWGTLKTLEFEKTGTVTTMIGRGFINKLLSKK